MKLVFSILGNVLDYMVQNSVRSLPTETPLKKPLFHKKVWGRKPSTNFDARHVKPSRTMIGRTLRAGSEHAELGYTSE